MKRYFGVAVVAGFLAGSMQMSADEAISITVRPQSCRIAATRS